MKSPPTEKGGPEKVKFRGQVQKSNSHAADRTGLTDSTVRAIRQRGSMKLGTHGRLVNSVPDKLVARMFEDYKRLGTLKAVGELHSRRGTTIWQLLRSRGFIRSRWPSERFIRKWYRDYCSGLSLEQVGDKYHRTRQTIFDVFKRRGFKLRARTFLEAVVYKGRKYTRQKVCGKHRYLRCTTGRGKDAHLNKKAYLHHVVWQEHNGPIPRGYKVCFKDGNHLNYAVENLELLSNSDQPRKHATGANQFTKTAKTRLDLLMGNFESGGGLLASQLEHRDQRSRLQRRAA